MHPTFIAWISFFFLAVLSINLIKNKWRKKKIPPGPWKLPIIGNMHHLMGSLPHHALARLAQKHGDLMHLQLGEISAIVVSSPRAAKAIHKTHDHTFSDRPEFLAAKIVLYNNSDVVFSPYGDYWRQLRKLCTTELLGNRTVRSLGSIRQDEIWKLVSSIREEARLQPEQGINLTQKFLSYTRTMVSRAAFGRAFGRHQDTLGELLKEVDRRLNGFNISDVFPSWKILYPLTMPKLVELRDKIDEVLDIIIQEHVDNPCGKNGEFGQEDLVDVLLRIQQNGDFGFPITKTTMKAVILDMFGGGTETTTILVEWAMVEMMKNPNVLARAQDEIRQVSVSGKTRIEENDIQKLSYLKSVIKETLRLHPSIPLNLRYSREECEIDGFIIPPKTRVIINAWAIGRDPKYWDEPECFEPKRFENNYSDFVGIDYEYLPFGGGRRICPGISFGLANAEIQLANLLFYFDWKLPDNVDVSSLEITTNALTATRKNDLFLIASMCESLGHQF